MKDVYSVDTQAICIFNNLCALMTILAGLSFALGPTGICLAIAAGGVMLWALGITFVGNVR